MVPRAAWPNYECDEFDGAGWLAEVLEVNDEHSKVRFVHARDASGRPWRAVRLESNFLRPLDASGAEPAGGTPAGAP